MSMSEEINGNVTDANFDLFLVTDESGVRNLRNDWIADEEVALFDKAMNRMSAEHFSHVSRVLKCAFPV